MRRKSRKSYVNYGAILYEAARAFFTVSFLQRFSHKNKLWALMSRRAFEYNFFSTRARYFTKM